MLILIFDLFILIKVIFFFLLMAITDACSQDGEIRGMDITDACQKIGFSEFFFSFSFSLLIRSPCMISASIENGSSVLTLFISLGFFCISI